MNVLFVCTANAGRSVLSERLFERRAEGRHHARSAGSDPGAEAHPQVIDVLLEVGIDASDHVPRKLTEELIDWSDVVVATCDDSCPYVPGKHYRNWHLPDPKGEPIDRVRDLRDDIAGRVEALVRELDAAGVPASSVYDTSLRARGGRERHAGSTLAALLSRRDSRRWSQAPGGERIGGCNQSSRPEP